MAARQRTGRHPRTRRSCCRLSSSGGAEAQDYPHRAEAVIPMLTTFFAALGAFIAHLLTSLVLLVAFLGVYSLATPYSELKLVREGNAAAAIAMGGAMIGFAIALAQAVRISGSIGETIVWGIVALAIQIAGHFAVRRFLPGLARDIIQGSSAAAMTLAATAITLGLINAACMTP
ncbi:MAG: DUF350 domain-containing protein [Hyphomicrobiaceae bacterium]|nr:MAG: DUF350 domain-containing protein [Hyphomicrobiaceae bacterium]